MSGRDLKGTGEMTPLRFIAILRGARPDNRHYYLNGGCWELFRILRGIWPQAQPYHTWTDLHGHVATEIDGYLYDIRGRIKKPSLYSPMTTTSWPALRGHHAPHRWHKSYSILHALVAIPTGRSPDRQPLDLNSTPRTRAQKSP